MRPVTLAEAASRLRRGEPIEKAIAEFLDAFYAAGDRDSAYGMLVEEPADVGEVKSDALLAAVAEYLAIQFTGRRPPKWATHPKRVLAEPLFTSQSQAPAMKAWLVHNSPAEFKNHNIFTESHPLRRKLTDRVSWAPKAKSAGAICG